MDARIATEFARLQNLDKGPLPYFVDTMHPPIYDEGVRVEGPMDAGGSEENNESGEENEIEGIATLKKVEEMVDEQMRGKLEVAGKNLFSTLMDEKEIAV